MGLLEPKANSSTRGKEAWLVYTLERLRLEAIASGRAFVTVEEFGRFWFDGRPWRPEALKQARMRLKRFFRARGVDFRMVTTEENGLEIHVVSEGVWRVIEPYVLEARKIVARSDARRRGAELEPKVERGLARELERQRSRLETSEGVAEVVVRYRDKSQRIEALARVYGAGKDRLRRLLEGAKVSVRPQGRYPIEVHRGPELVQRALELRARGGSIRDVAQVLGPCDVHTAARFLARQRPSAP